MTNELFIAGDWGTTNLRLYLCEYGESGTTKILDKLSGPGVGQIKAGFEETFFQLAGDWLAKYGKLPVIISGMAGSTIGWKEAPYLQCPADAKQIANGRVVFEARGTEISIVAGLKASSPLGLPDVMRGEELQLLGWMQLQAEIPKGDYLFALPGTHNKWVLVKDGSIETFITSPTGELFSALKNHSVLVAKDAPKETNEKVFLEGVEAIEQLGDAHLVHVLFATRSRQVLGEIAQQDGASYLSGLLIGADTLGAMAVFSKLAPNLSAVVVIGEAHLSEFYRLVLQRLGIQAELCDPSDIAVAGFSAIYEQLYKKD